MSAVSQQKVYKLFLMKWRIGRSSSSTKIVCPSPEGSVNICDSKGKVSNVANNMYRCDAKRAFSVHDRHRQYNRNHVSDDDTTKGKRLAKPISVYDQKQSRA